MTMKNRDITDKLLGMSEALNLSAIQAQWCREAVSIINALRRELTETARIGGVAFAQLDRLSQPPTVATEQK